VIVSFRNRGTEDIFQRVDSLRARRMCPSQIWPAARRRLDELDNAETLSQAGRTRGADLHPLHGDRSGQHALRINDKYRICFRWTQAGVEMSRSSTTTDGGLRMHGFTPQDLLVRVPTHGRATHPGEVLRADYLPDLGWTAGDLAGRLRLPLGRVEALLAEEAPVDPELALRLGKLFGQSPAFWIKHQLRYDYYDAFRVADADLEVIETLPAPEIVEEPESEPLRKAS
jgi:proteic killer suppression protein